MTAALAIAAIANAPPTHARVIFEDCKGGMCGWQLSGPISRDDLAEVRAIAAKLNALPADAKPTLVSFRLNSEGGDLDAAIAIGRELRRLSAAVAIGRKNKCYSSCVFVLAGGVRRGAVFNVGIHRPYSTQLAERDYTTIQEEQRRIASRAKAYLEEMNVSPSLFDAMMRVAPENVRLLTNDEVEAFGLTSVDPAYQELLDTNAARHYRLSKTEYLRRKATIAHVCKAFLERVEVTGADEDVARYSSCQESVFTAR